jgi:hypothetical protein
LLVEPGVRLLFRDDGKDLDFRFSNVIEHPDVANPETVLRLAHTAKSLNAALADLHRLVLQMPLNRILDASANWR